MSTTENPGMHDSLEAVLARYVEEIDGTKYFLGDETRNEDFEAAALIADCCPFYLDDQEEEIYIEGLRTCYNCRYRRWAQNSFSCYHRFSIGA
jgi:hypothetical protein